MFLNEAQAGKIGLLEKYSSAYSLLSNILVSNYKMVRRRP
jgi:hypothetical protein